MIINHSEYFKELGFSVKYYDSHSGQFDVDEITGRIRQIVDQWKAKYPNLRMKYENIKYDNLVNFNVSFTTEVEHLNVDATQNKST